MIPKGTRFDWRTFHEGFVEKSNAESHPEIAKQGSSNRSSSGIFAETPFRNLENVTGPNCDRAQSAEVNEAKEWQRCLFDFEKPIGDLI